MKNLSRFLALYRPYRAQVFLGIALSAVSLSASIGLLALSGWFITAMGIAGAAGLTLNYFTPAAIIRACAILRTGGRYADRLVNHDAALRVTASFRQWFYERLEPLAPARLQDLHSGEIFARLRGDIDTLERFYLNGFLPLCTAAIGGAGVFAALSVYSPALGCIEAGLLAAAGFGIPLLLGRVGRADQAKMDALLRRARADMADTIQGMGEWLVYGGAESRAASFDQISGNLAALQLRMARRDALAHSAALLAMGCALAAGLWLAAPIADSGAFAGAQAGLIALLCLAGFDAVLAAPLALQSLGAARAAAMRVFDITDRTPDATPARTVPETPFSLKADSLSFAYRDRPVLKNLSFEIRAGEIASVTGPSGAGKTTLLNLLAVFWRPGPGMLLLNGRDIGDCDPESVRARFSFAPQKPYIFADTIRANLRLADPDATEAMLDEVCEAAGLADVIRDLPEGYDTYIGENGLKLSGGQIRRLSLARALLKPAPCLILDEPGEGLDPAREAEVMRSVLVLAAKRGQTVLIAAHKPVSYPGMRIIAIPARHP